MAAFDDYAIDGNSFACYMSQSDILNHSENNGAKDHILS